MIKKDKPEEHNFQYYDKSTETLIRLTERKFTTRTYGVEDPRDVVLYTGKAFVLFGDRQSILQETEETEEGFPFHLMTKPSDNLYGFLPDLRRYTRKGIIAGSPVDPMDIQSDFGRTLFQDIENHLGRVETSALCGRFLQALHEHSDGTDTVMIEWLLENTQIVVNYGAPTGMDITIEGRTFRLKDDDVITSKNFTIWFVSEFGKYPILSKVDWQQLVTFWSQRSIRKDPASDSIAEPIVDDFLDMLQMATCAVDFGPAVGDKISVKSSVFVADAQTDSVFVPVYMMNSLFANYNLSSRKKRQMLGSFLKGVEKQKKRVECENGSKMQPWFWVFKLSRIRSERPGIIPSGTLDDAQNAQDAGVQGMVNDGLSFSTDPTDMMTYVFRCKSPVSFKLDGAQYTMGDDDAEILPSKVAKHLESLGFGRADAV